MTARNPIDQRRANRKGTGCPVFWRRIGIPLSQFFVLLPWVMVILMLSRAAFLQSVGGTTALIEKSIAMFHFITDFFDIIFLAGNLLLLLALAWYMYFFVAACRGFPKEGRKIASLFVWSVYAALWYLGCLSLEHVFEAVYFD